ncbi:MAG TPA: aminotransferase class IV [Treponemataceae bacterium]|nr:aminotransferase class IV [Treponemataceae bacterium]
MSNVANVRVAIRTAVFDHAGKSARYGTGSGIAWGSDALAERRECLDKTAVLDSDDGFYVFDSMLLENGGISDLDAHLARLRKSCRYFFLPESTHDGLENELLSLCRNTTDGSWKVRILCSANGTRKIECDPVPPLPAPYCVAPAPGRLAADNPFFAHKTSRREHLDAALREARIMYGEALADAVLVNSRGELMETTRANIVLEIDGKKYTPPLDSGILPGVFRAGILERGLVQEKKLYMDDWHRADRIWAVNSVRGWIEAERIPPDFRASRGGDSGPSCPF